jgi:hypothetical protein
MSLQRTAAIWAPITVGLGPDVKSEAMRNGKNCVAGNTSE